MSQDGTADDQPFPSNPAVTKSIEELKNALATAPILAHPDYNGSKFIVDTDFSVSNCAVG